MLPPVRQIERGRSSSYFLTEGISLPGYKGGINEHGQWATSQWNHSGFTITSIIENKVWPFHCDWLNNNPLQPGLLTIVEKAGEFSWRFNRVDPVHDNEEFCLPVGQINVALVDASLVWKLTSLWKDTPLFWQISLCLFWSLYMMYLLHSQHHSVRLAQVFRCSCSLLKGISSSQILHFIARLWHSFICAWIEEIIANSLSVLKQGLVWEQWVAV